jgi:hypothetical protein
MRKFNIRLARFIDSGVVEKVAMEVAKPQSMRAIARKLEMSVYAVKRLLEYHNSLKTN